MPKTRKKSVKQEISDSHRYCRYCKAHRDRRGYKKHFAACKKIWKIREDIKDKEQALKKRKKAKSLRARKTVVTSGREAENQIATADNISNPVSSTTGVIGGEHESDEESSDSNSRAFGPHLPDSYIKIIPHPHSIKKDVKIVPLTTGSLSSSVHGNEKYVPLPESRPWAPFRTLADFEYTETAVQGLLSKELINKQLAGLNGGWAVGSRLTIRNYKDMQESLARARLYVVRFRKGTVSAVYKGERFEFEFQYRDPWEYILNLVQDKSLASVSCWNSVRKLYCCKQGTVEDRIIDEPCTADRWWEVDSSLPEGPFPHCYLPLHFWLDKGLVTRRVKKYPMILRGAWLPAIIRNASGNGGGILLGYMQIIEDPADPSDRGPAETLEFAQFKREVYQKILSRIFGPLGRRSRQGEAHVCNDDKTRILHPGILIESQDGEEASYFCACRAATATFPCPKCLVSKSELDQITKTFEQRTSESMKAVFERASNAGSKTAKEKILQAFGLHDIKHFLWDFQFSDPYIASSYDTLHSDDVGKWGKHLWEVLTAVLERGRKLGQLTMYMSQFPAWNGLKHFNHVSTIPFTDGQSYYDILKCILPCIVQLLPRNSSLVHCIRAYQCYRLMIGLRCMTDTRLRRLEELIKVYEKQCSKVSKDHGKNFNFFKQHYVSHVVSDIRGKGTTDNMSTRPGEGFQQEAAQAYKQTNRKQAENQMVRIDETQEVIACIRMAIDDDNKARAIQSKEPNESHSGIKNKSELSSYDRRHWAFGSPSGGRSTTSQDLEQNLAAGNHDFFAFDERLRSFIMHNFPEEAPHYEDLIHVELFKCVYVTYQSLEDWSEGRDILRCNADFHQRARYDCLIIDEDSPGTTVARLRSLLRCRLPSGKLIDLALIHAFTESRWRPYTKWDNCQIREEATESTFVLMDYVVRGALMCHVFGSDNPRLHYLVDTVDGDMLLRVNGWGSYD